MSPIGLKSTSGNDKTALVVVDVQNDFVLPEGALYVPGAERIVPIINKVYEWLGKPWVVYTRDWHIKGTAHFDRWPVHCLANTKGAKFVDGLVTPSGSMIFEKGQSIHDDGYSGFDKTGMDTILKLRGYTSLYVVGVATDWCVKATVLDALKLGFHVCVITDAVAAVDEEAGKLALREMANAGASFTTVVDHTKGFHDAGMVS